jgi:hypothetical protein
MIGLALMMMRQSEIDAGPGWDGVFFKYGPGPRHYYSGPLTKRYYELVDACPLRMQLLNGTTEQT